MKSQVGLQRDNKVGVLIQLLLSELYLRPVGGGSQAELI